MGQTHLLIHLENTLLIVNFPRGGKLLQSTLWVEASRPQEPPGMVVG
jgi:hypothetical protein